VTLRTLCAGQISVACVYSGHLLKVGHDLHQPVRVRNRKRRNKTAFTMLKIAVFAPTPKARESTATMVKPGLFQAPAVRTARPAITWSSTPPTV
jgi:hypothetical protein